MISFLRETDFVASRSPKIGVLRRRSRHSPVGRVCKRGRDQGLQIFSRRCKYITRELGRAEAIIGKQRHGPTGTVQLAFEAEITRFSNLAQEDRLPARID